MQVRGKARTPDEPVTCEILHKAGKWYASVTLEIEAVQRVRGTETGAFDWGLTEFLTIATPDGIETVANPRYLKNQLAELVKRFGMIATEALAVKNMVSDGGSRKKGLNREIHAAAPAAFLQMTRTKAEEAGSWYEEAPTRALKPTQRCHACWRLPDEKKKLSDREHQCPHCGTSCGRDEARNSRHTVRLAGVVHYTVTHDRIQLPLFETFRDAERF